MVNPPVAATGLIRALIVWAGVAFFASHAPAVADVFHLSDGGKVDGEVIEKTADSFRVRTVFGIVAVRFDQIALHETAPSPFERYQQRKKDAADTAAAQTELGQWCQETGLKTEAERHFRRAIELDPDYEPARAKLGHVRGENGWVERSSAATTQPATAPAKDRAADEEAAEKKLIATTQTRWSRQIRSIRMAFLESSDSKQLAEGRKRLAEIRDPLAILPAVRVLSEGGTAARTALIELLSRFREDEATLNLAAIALLESNEDIRSSAVSELVRRKDDRVLGQLRKALYADNDAVIRRAALALGALRAEPAIPDLIDQLTAQRRKSVETPIRRLLGVMEDEFRAQGDFIASGKRRYQPTLGVGTVGGLAGVDTEMQTRDVTVFRTEVQQALVAITGENFGFEADEWRTWYEERKR
ncbi:MAG: hypothetical protein HZB38_00345 [Planctomycetes bacterium]|nr:hypothetical protein [Planctomycetota bacterium]